MDWQETALPQEWPTPRYFHLAGFEVMLPLAVYATVFHCSIPILAHVSTPLALFERTPLEPSLSQPIRKKEQLGRMFAMAFVVLGIAYLAMGLTFAFYFGPSIGSQSNLIYVHYLGCATGTSPAPMWARIISFVILIFPALDVVSAYPLNAITVGNNLQTLFAPKSMRTTAPPDIRRIQVKPQEPSITPSQPQEEVIDIDEGLTPHASPCSFSASDFGTPKQTFDSPTYSAAGATEEEATRRRKKCCGCCTKEKWRRNRTRLLFRVLGSAPPIIGAAVVSDLGTILQFTGMQYHCAFSTRLIKVHGVVVSSPLRFLQLVQGVIGIVLALVVPPVLWKASQAVFTSVSTSHGNPSAHLKTCHASLTSGVHAEQTSSITIHPSSR